MKGLVVVPHAFSLPLRLAAVAAFALAACSDDDNAGTDTVSDTAPDTAVDTAIDSAIPEDSTATTDDATTVETTPETTAETVDETTPTETVVTRPVCEDHAVACQDQQIQNLGLSQTASGGAITEEGATPSEFLTHIDATAGGIDGTKGYTYARFTEGGLVAVALSDYDALESKNWDIAFRRFVVRLNSGISGPGCIVAGRTSPDTDFDDLSAVPASVTFHDEQYFTTDGCEYVPDTSGIGAPQTVLSSYWSYPGCVAMTGNVYVIWLADGRAVKFQVISYYTPAVQKNCDDNGEITVPSGGGNFRIRWAFVD